MINEAQARAFLACGRIAVVGASDDAKNFGGAVRKALVEHGLDVETVNPNAETVGGRPCYPSLADVPDAIDGVLVMVSGPPVLDVLHVAAERGIRNVWLFKGLGGKGAASEDAIRLGHELGLDVVEGACPLMFLSPVRGAHRFHRGLRHLNGSLRRAA
jgi:predicted CoA-binding protein